MTRLWSTLLLSVLALVLTCGPCAGAEIRGVTFAERVVVQDTALELRGAALLKWAVLFPVYAGAFYLPEGHPTPLWTADVPKRLELSYFREFETADFVDSSDQLLRRNLSAAEYGALAERLEYFYGLFQPIRPGDRYSLNYSPQSGTELRLNDQPLGAVPGQDFATAYFGIWLGPQPIDKTFRDRLLGN